jgi:SAM-dependent methyltransferase
MPQDIRAAIDRAYLFEEELERLLEQGAITEEEWFERNRRHFTGHYLAGDNPRAQSGHGGDEGRYRYTQGMLLSAIHRSGTFVDIGCANGYLVEKLVEWLEGSGSDLQVHGLDISPELVELARSRLPQWADRFFVGNALHWSPPRTFDFVCVKELGYVPRRRRRELFVHLREDCVSPGGRLILGPLTEVADAPGIESELLGWGYLPDGSATKPHQEHVVLIRRLLWFDRAREPTGGARA